MAAAVVDPAGNGVDVDITFRVEEKRTGNINFGASLGQGTGVGGFLGLEEPNLFGRGKRGRLQWQFGTNINDFTLSYSDPAIKESLLSGTVSIYDSRQRYTIKDLGQRRQIGGSIQLGLPFFGSRYTRLFGTYGLQRIRYSDGSEDIQKNFVCNNCTRSTLGTTLLRDTRVGLPFATGGSQTTLTGELNGGFLGGTGHYQKVDVEGRWYAPLGTLGGSGNQFGGGVQFVLGLTAKSGFVFGDAHNFFTELYTLGGVQFGVPLRGYTECSVTPNGYDASAGGSSCSPAAFGKSYASFTVEAGARVSQALYLSTFLDAGNVYRTARQYDPTRLYRGAGVGVALVSPSARSGWISHTDSIGSTPRGSRTRAGSCTSRSATSSSSSDRTQTGAPHEVRSRRPPRRLWPPSRSALAAPAAAQQTAPGTKIAFVNSQRILKETPGYAQAETTFTKELAGFRNEVSSSRPSSIRPRLISSSRARC